MAIKVARTRNLPDSRHFLLIEVLVSVPHEDRQSSNHVRRDDAVRASQDISPDPREQQETRKSDWSTSGTRGQQALGGLP